MVRDSLDLSSDYEIEHKMLNFDTLFVNIGLAIIKIEFF
jgi:hypothetical protein